MITNKNKVSVFSSQKVIYEEIAVMTNIRFRIRDYQQARLKEISNQDQVLRKNIHDKQVFDQVCANGGTHNTVKKCTDLTIILNKDKLVAIKDKNVKYTYDKNLKGLETELMAYGIYQ